MRASAFFRRTLHTEHCTLNTYPRGIILPPTYHHPTTILPPSYHFNISEARLARSELGGRRSEAGRNLIPPTSYLRPKEGVIHAPSMHHPCTNHAPSLHFNISGAWLGACWPERGGRKGQSGAGPVPASLGCGCDGVCVWYFIVL